MLFLDVVDDFSDKRGHNCDGLKKSVNLMPQVQRKRYLLRW
jgi:hypothetical protein